MAVAEDLSFNQAGRLVIEEVSHRYGRLLVVDQMTLTVGDSEIVCLLGPSGCGKSTLLRVAAGLEQLQEGRVYMGGDLVATPSRAVPPEARGVGLVFQDYALFPHLNVLQNVEFGLHGFGRRKRAEEMLERVGMVGYEETFPHELSGGEQQRVALARALAPAPRINLLDEPFSGLDTRLRHQVRDEILHILKDSGAGTLMVTHDPEEAMFMADRIAVMRAGQLEQVGSPSDLYFHPATAFVAELFGEVNRCTGLVNGGSVATPFGPIPAGRIAEGTEVEVLIRPEAIRRSDDKTRTATVQTARLLGRTSLIHLELINDSGPGLHAHMRVPGCFLPARGMTLGLDLDTTQAFVFPILRPKYQG